MIQAIKRYIAKRRNLAALALEWSDAIATGCIDVAKINAKRSHIARYAPNSE